jgi:hypothetical protein
MGLSLGSIASSVGNFVEDTCDELGLPEPVGDIAAGAVNVMTGNYAGAVEDGLDLLPNVAAGADALFQKEPTAPGQRSYVVAHPVGAGAEGQGPALASAAPAGGGPGSPGFDPRKAAEEMGSGVKPAWMKQEDWDRFQLQQQTEKYKEMINLLTQLMKMQHECAMAIINNIGR